MNVPTKRLPLAGVALAVAILLCGCDTRASRAEAAFNRYQAAMGAGDLLSARIALLALVAANEDVPSYWVELGKVQFQLKDYSGAYYAFTRASELNRGDPEVLRYLTQISLQSGDLETAEQRSKELDLLAPGDPMVKIAAGLIALRRRDFEFANQRADEILATAPLDQNARVIKSRALVGLGRRDEALHMLERQIASQPNDASSMQELVNLHRAAGEWAPIAVLGQRYASIFPGNRKMNVLTVEAGLRSGDTALAKAASLRVLKPDAAPDAIDAVLELWRLLWRGSEPTNLAVRLAEAAGGAQRISYARYLNASGQAGAAMRLVQAAAGEDPAPANVDARAVYDDSLARLGRGQEARQGLEAILREDPDNDIALAALAPLLVAQGEKGQAINLARKLVTVAPTSVDARLTLAQCYQASGDRDAAVSSLWDAVHTLPAEERLYTALRSYVGHDSDAAQRLDSEFADQKQRKLMQEAM